MRVFTEPASWLLCGSNQETVMSIDSTTVFKCCLLAVGVTFSCVVSSLISPACMNLFEDALCLSTRTLFMIAPRETDKDTDTHTHTHTHTHRERGRWGFPGVLLASRCHVDVLVLAVVGRIQTLKTGK